MESVISATNPATTGINGGVDDALNLIRREKTAWETGVAFVTERVAFQMRNLVRQLRKNYWSVFEEPVDPISGRKKIWHPLTEYLVESAVKNIDLDTKDISLRAKKSSAQPLASVLRQALRNYLEKIDFGELLDMSERQAAIDGTVVWKTYEDVGYDGKKRLCVKLVDLLNWYIDPVVDSIKEAESVIERSIMTPEAIAEMTGWMNTQGLSGTTTINRYDGQMPYIPTTTQGETKLREVFERWGKMPKHLLTGNKQDKEQVEGRIIASSNGTDWVLHLIEANTKTFDDGSPWRPYEEFRYKRIHGRWYGKGIAEKVMWLQLYLNEVMGIRRNRSIIQQLGLFKIRAGSNITPQMIGRLLTTGGLKVTDIDKDIAPLEFPQSGIAESYNDEKNTLEWGQRVTGLFEPATGDQLPASQPATTTAIQSQSAQSEFVLIKEGLGMFLDRWLKYHCLPFVIKNLKKGDVIRITGEWGELQQLDEWKVDGELAEYVDEMTEKGLPINFSDIQFERARALDKLKKAGDDRYFEYDKEQDPTEYDVEVVITNEEINKSVLMQNLTNMLGVVPPNMQQQIVREIFDLVGLDWYQYDKQNSQQMPMQPMAQQQQGMQPLGVQQQMQQAMQPPMMQPNAAA